MTIMRKEVYRLHNKQSSILTVTVFECGVFLRFGIHSNTYRLHTKKIFLFPRLYHLPQTANLKLLVPDYKVLTSPCETTAKVKAALVSRPKYLYHAPL